MCLLGAMCYVLCGCYMVDWWLQDSYTMVNRLLLGGCLVVARWMLGGY